MKDLIEKVIEWGYDKNILTDGTMQKQALKTQEECGELLIAVGEGDFFGIVDGIGDVMVTLILLAHMNGIKLEDCLQAAYSEIKDRTGSIKNGTFVKDC